jgi:hypothetical protein
LGSLRKIVIDPDEALIPIGRNAIWKASGGDYPVTILGDLGMGPDARRYVAVESTNAGIPLDELELDSFG